LKICGSWPSTVSRTAFPACRHAYRLGAPTNLCGRPAHSPAPELLIFHLWRPPVILMVKVERASAPSPRNSERRTTPPPNRRQCPTMDAAELARSGEPRHRNGNSIATRPGVARVTFDPYSRKNARVVRNDFNLCLIELFLRTSWHALQWIPFLRRQRRRFRAGA